jgi:hypothetical protein
MLAVRRSVGGAPAGLSRLKERERKAGRSVVGKMGGDGCTAEPAADYSDIGNFRYGLSEHGILLKSFSC